MHWPGKTAHKHPLACHHCHLTALDADFKGPAPGSDSGSDSGLILGSVKGCVIDCGLASSATGVFT